MATISHNGGSGGARALTRKPYVLEEVIDFAVIAGDVTTERDASRTDSPDRSRETARAVAAVLLDELLSHVDLHRLG